MTNVYLEIQQLEKLLKQHHIMDVTILKKFVCLRCKNKWWPGKINEDGEVTHLPQVCPRCNTRFWNTPRKNKIRFKD